MFDESQRAPAISNRHDRSPPPHWTETAVPLALLATQLLAALQCGTALLSFARRDDVPEARLTTGS